MIKIMLTAAISKLSKFLPLKYKIKEQEELHFLGKAFL